jgi:hypothetical protein
MSISLSLSITTALSSGFGFTPELLFEAGEQGAWLDPDLTTCFTDTAGTTPVLQVGNNIRRINDKSPNEEFATGQDGLFATVPRPAVFNNKVSSTLIVDLPFLGTDATIGYSTDEGVTILTGQTAGGLTEILIDRYLFAFVAIDRALTASEADKLNRYLTQRRAGYVAPQQFDGAFLLEGGDKLLLESGGNLTLEGAVSYPLNTTS